MRDLGYADEHGLKLLVESSKDVLAEQEIIREKKILEEFFETLGKNPEMAVYGLAGVKKALDYGAVRKLLLSKKLAKDISVGYKEIADRMGTEIDVISVETSEGEQFWNLSGVGALLRYRIE
jgi:peptide subunit release factor 1 (eRF1)